MTAKLNRYDLKTMRAAVRYGVVAGGPHGTHARVYSLIDRGLLTHSATNASVYTPTGAGLEALRAAGFHVTYDRNGSLITVSVPS